MKTKYLRNVIIAIALVLAGALGTYLLIGSDEEKTEQNVPVNEVATSTFSTADGVTTCYGETIEDADAAYLRGDYTMAVRVYKELAEQGNAAAQYNLGTCYALGQGVNKSQEEAMKWFVKAETQGYKDLSHKKVEEKQKMSDADNAYIHGNYMVAVRIYKELAECGNAMAQYSLGNCYELGQGVEKSNSDAQEWYSKAVKGFRKEASRGDADAQYFLGSCYTFGKGVVSSDSEALKWFLKAAEQGHMHAQFACFSKYAQGIGVTESKEEAVKWLYKAAEQGYSEAQYLLGYWYTQGFGTAVSKEEAEKWYRRAAEQGVEKAKQALEELENERKAKTAEQKRKEEEHLAAERHRQKSVKKETPADGIKAYELGDYATAFRIFKENADDNYIAQYYLGLCYFNGQGVEESKTEAAKLYRKAAESGYIYAQYSLGHYYIVYTTDEEEGVKWYTMAAERGHIGAQIGLGLYMKRTDNWSAAIKWMTRAAEAGHAYAQFLLGQMYEKGNPTADYAFRKANGLEEETISITDAVKWYRKSANQGNESAKEALKRLGY